MNIIWSLEHKQTLSTEAYAAWPPHGHVGQMTLWLWLAKPLCPLQVRGQSGFKAIILLEGPHWVLDVDERADQAVQETKPPKWRSEPVTVISQSSWTFYIYIIGCMHLFILHVYFTNLLGRTKTQQWSQLTRVDLRCLEIKDWPLWLGLLTKGLKTAKKAPHKYTSCYYDNIQHTWKENVFFSIQPFFVLY